MRVYKVPLSFLHSAKENVEGAKDGSTVQLGKHESAVVQIVAKESKSYKAASSSQNGASTNATGKAADASKTTQDKVPDTLQQALRKLVLLSQNAVLYCSVLPLYQVPLAIQLPCIEGYSMFFYPWVMLFVRLYVHSSSCSNSGKLVEHYCKPTQQHPNIGLLHV